MPPKKQTTLTIPKTRRHTKQLHKSKVISDDNSITQIGGSQGSTVATSTKKKLEIHQEGLDDTDKLLRDFDLNYAYGPCVGIKRIDRWERAESLGLNPPEVVKKVLLHDKSKKYENSVFHQFRMI